MTKLPFLQFYPGDWLKDPKLSMCSPATRGIWIDALAAMHESDRSGVLTGSPDQLARVLRCSPSDVQVAARELMTTGTANVRESNGLITLENRRMLRESKERKQSNLRQERYKARHGNNGHVTDRSPPNNTDISISMSKDDSLRSSSAAPDPEPQRESVWLCTPEALELAKRLKAAIHARDPQAAAGINGRCVRWGRDIDILLKRRTSEQISAAVDWCQRNGCFWSGVVLSGRKLREEFDKIWAQMQRDRPTVPDQVGPSAPSVSCPLCEDVGSLIVIREVGGLTVTRPWSETAETYYRDTGRLVDRKVCDCTAKAAEV